MTALNKIFISTLAISYMALASVCVYGQNIVKAKKHKPTLTIGFQSGRELLFHSNPLIHSRQSKVHYNISNSLVLRKALNAHFKVETGLKYNSIPGTVAKIKSVNDRYGTSTYTCYTAHKVAAPFTIQYYFLPKRCKVQPFFGTGFQYNFNPNNTYPPFTSAMGGENAVPSGTKYINVLFTEGFTFQVNTRIQLTQSCHFMPGSNEKTIGIDLGIGYSIR